MPRTNKTSNANTPAVPSAPVVPATNSNLPPQSTDTPSVLNEHVVQSFDPDISHYNLITIEGKVDEQELKNRFAEVCRINADKDFILNVVTQADKETGNTEQAGNIAYNRIFESIQSLDCLTFQDGNNEQHVIPGDIFSDDDQYTSYTGVAVEAKESVNSFLGSFGQYTENEQALLDGFTKFGILEKTRTVHEDAYDMNERKSITKEYSIYAPTNWVNHILLLCPAIFDTAITLAIRYASEMLDAQKVKDRLINKNKDFSKNGIGFVPRTEASNKNTYSNLSERLSKNLALLKQLTAAKSKANP